MADNLDTAQNRVAIGDLISRYAQAIDAADIDAVLQCFSPDAPTSYNDGAIVLKDRAALGEFLRASPVAPSTHVMTNVLIRFEAGGASGETSAVAFVTRVPGFVTVRGLHYSDRFALRDGHWVITDRRHSARWECAIPGGPIAK